MGAAGLLRGHDDARGARFFRFAHADGLIAAGPAVYARLPRVQRDVSRTQGLDRRELIRFLQVAQTISVNHGAPAYLLGINSQRASEAAAVHIEHYADTLRRHRVLHLIDKADKPATMPLTVPVLRVLEACRGQRTTEPLVLRPVSEERVDRRDAYRMVTRMSETAGLRTTEHYDRARGNLDRHGVHFLAHTSTACERGPHPRPFRPQGLPRSADARKERTTRPALVPSRLRAGLLLGRLHP